MANVRCFIATIAVLMSATSLLLAEDARPDSSADPASLVGVWVADKVVSAGREVPEEKFPFELHLTESQLTYKFVGATTGRDRVYEISLDPTQSPATIDITRTVRDRRGTVHGIYKFEEGKLFICSLRGADGNPSDDRPATFESSRDNRADLLILKRKHKTDGDRRE